MANRVAGATSGNSTWDDLAIALSSLILNVVGGTTIVIEWADGSKTVLKVEADAAHRAKYQQGMSENAQGIRIADGAASEGSSSGSEYAGNYNFENPEALQQWANTARMFGVQIGGEGGGSNMSCSWINNTLTCNIY